MGLREEKSKYISFSYLEQDKDFKAFDLAPERNNFKEYYLALTAEEEEIVKSMAKKTLMVSLHDHAVILPKNIENLFNYIREGRIFTSYQGLIQSYWDVIFDGFMAGMCTINSRHGWKWADVIDDIGMRLCDIEHQDKIVKCTNINEIYKAFQDKKIAFIPTLESSSMIENEIDRIDILYGLGIRVMGITYSESNLLGTGLREDKDGGLTYFGVQAVERMNKVGMAIDCAHASDQTTIDVINKSKKPIFISHIGAKGLKSIRRFKDDSILKLCADKGGVIGVEAAPNTTTTKKNPKHNLESYMEHFEYIKDLVGIDHVAFGPDTFFGDQVAMQHIFSEALSLKQYASSSNQKEINNNSEIMEEAKYAEGIENLDEASKNILRWLVKHKYSEEDMRKVLGGNVMRALKEIW